jgi:hypothetical protein
MAVRSMDLDTGEAGFPCHLGSMAEALDEIEDFRPRQRLGHPEPLAGQTDGDCRRRLGVRIDGDLRLAVRRG